MDVETKLDTPLGDIVAQKARRPSSGRAGGSGPMRKKGSLSSTSRVARSSPYNTRPRPTIRRSAGRSGPPPARAPGGGGGSGGRVGRTIRPEGGADDPLSGGDYIKVGGGTVPRNLAGLIINQVSAATVNTLLAPIIAVGPASVNQAVKGLAIARKSLDEQRTEFVFMPSFVRLQSEDLNAIQIDIERSTKRKTSSEEMELRAAGSTEVKGLAGALAKNARQSAASFVTVVGANSVNQAIKAIAIARGYLEEEGIDLQCRSSIEEIDAGQLAGKSALSISVHPVSL
mmetsp:Transcript_11116/g.28919  ORF Transcript_11116/g.28919 Transcript_11116/m.28919 type:complete len:286 (+) Transcript_11116:61-918(+)